jgi:hypothetical protein
MKDFCLKLCPAGFEHASNLSWPRKPICHLPRQAISVSLSRHHGWCLGVNGLSTECVLPEAFMLIYQHHRLRPHQGADPFGAVLFHDDFRQRMGIGSGDYLPAIYKRVIAK